MADTDARPDTRRVDESLFAPGEPLTLQGACCENCATTTFPAQGSCPRCGGEKMAVVALPRTGTLWSFTVQGFEPKTPYRSAGEFRPYGVGYVDLGSVIVESRLTESNPDRMDIGEQLQLTAIPVFADEDGTKVLTFAFAPIGALDSGELA